MDKFLAIFAVALGAVYSDFSSDDWMTSILFPFLFVTRMAYLFWFKGLVAIILGSAAAYHSDITSTSILYSILFPLFIVICFLSAQQTSKPPKRVGHCLCDNQL